VIRKLQAAALAVGLSLALSSCGYQGYTRYPCQEFENWEKDECQRPQCEAQGICTEDILGDIVKPQPKQA
jgi:uncharacterized membrane protein YebE (DUF533 family)